MNDLGRIVFGPRGASGKTKSGHNTQGFLTTHFHIVEGQIGGDLGGLDQAVIGDDLHTGISGFVHRGDSGIAVFGDHDQALDALRDHVVDLVVLQFHIMVGFLNDNLVALLLQQFRRAVRFCFQRSVAKSEKERPILIFSAALVLQERSSSFTWFGRALIFGDVAIDIIVGLESAHDDLFIDIVLGDLNDRQEDAVARRQEDPVR